MLNEKWNFVCQHHAYFAKVKISKYQHKYILLFQISQLTFTCSKLAKETLEKGGKYVQS